MTTATLALHGKTRKHSIPTHIDKPSEVNHAKTDFDCCRGPGDDDIGLQVMRVQPGWVSLQQQVEKQWAQVQNVYQRRADLIPNLVATVSGAANFEKSTLVEIAEARASVGKIDASQVADDPAKFAEFEKAQSGLSSALSRLLVVVERYPRPEGESEFPRSAGPTGVGTENRISVERLSRYNDVVQ